MHANAIALSALLLGTGLLGSATAQAVTTDGEYGSAHPAQAAREQPAAPLIQLADGGKLADKYMAGKAGGAKGIGGQKGKREGK
jgi:hypothetical protein